MKKNRLHEKHFFFYTVITVSSGVSAPLVQMRTELLTKRLLTQLQDLHDDGEFSRNDTEMDSPAPCRVLGAYLLNYSRI